MAGGPNISIMVHHDLGRVSRPPPSSSREQKPTSRGLCTKYQIKYSCLGPDKSLRLHKHWPCLLSGLHYSLCIHPGFVPLLPTHILRYILGFSMHFPNPTSRYLMWKKLLTISPPHWDCGAVMMWCEILDNLQFNKFLWNEWSLIVWCEAERGAEHVIMLCHPVNNCNNFLPLPSPGPTLFAI